MTTRNCIDCKFSPEWSEYQGRNGYKSAEGYCQWEVFHKLPTPYRQAKIKRLRKFQSVECECWEHNDAEEDTL